MLIGELKELTASASGTRAVIKHVPDLAFRVSEQMTSRSIGRKAPRLERFGEFHNVVIGTFDIDIDGVPSMEQFDVIPMTARWLPCYLDLGDAPKPYERRLPEGTSPAAKPFLGSATSR